MNKNELREILKREGFDPDSYDLDGGLLPEKYTLSEEAGVWSVYYSERGLQTGKRTFATEGEACEYFLDEMRDDPTTKA
ncbi:MAG: hypothetical protein KF847_09120 [Pirellulales bacterium]|nr:hypothetical protein [Pirellulales bacterium]